MEHTAASYRARSHIPRLVLRAMQASSEAAFENSCHIETGRLLRVLASQVREGTVGEIGTGCGVGAAWMVSVLQPGVPFVTIDREEERVETARQLLTDYPQVTVIHGEWDRILEHGPFSLLFCDAPSKREEPERVLEAVRVGGMVVLDDLTPEEFLPADFTGQPDPVREFWLNDRRVAAKEIFVNPTMQMLLATRLS